MRFLLNGTRTPTDKFVLKQESSMAFTWKQGKPAREPRSRPNGLRSFLHSKYFSFGCRFWLLLTFKTLEQARDSKKKDVSTFFARLYICLAETQAFVLWLWFRSSLTMAISLLTLKYRRDVTQLPFLKPPLLRELEQPQFIVERQTFDLKTTFHNRHLISVPLVWWFSCTSHLFRLLSSFTAWINKYQGV